MTFDAALEIGVRLCAVARIISAAELFLVRGEFGDGGMLDWSIAGLLPAPNSMRVSQWLQDLLRHLGQRSFIISLTIDTIASIALFAMPGSRVWLALAVMTHALALRTYPLSIDGSDHMMLVFLVACLIGRLGATDTATLMTCVFVASEVALAYVVAGMYKASSKFWQDGRALLMVVQTRFFGGPRFEKAVRTHPEAARAFSLAGVLWECTFPIVLLAPSRVVWAILAAGILFHVTCAIVMGLNTFFWAFIATYPAVLVTNQWLREVLSPGVANVIAGGVLLGILGAVWYLTRFVHLTGLRPSPAAARSAKI